TPTNPIASIRLVRNGIVQAEPVIGLSADIRRDSGIFGIAADPDFSANHYFYVWYAIGPNSPSPHGSTVNRLARLTLDPATGKADPASYAIILDEVPWSLWHNGGGLRFLADGTLLITTG